jgi:hypothetical protein
LRRSILIAAAVALASIPATADAGKPETCLGREVDVVIDKKSPRRTVLMNSATVLVRRDRAQVIFDDDQEAAGDVCVKKAKHVRIHGALGRVHTTGKDTRVFLTPFCFGDDKPSGGERFFHVYMVEVRSCFNPL